MTPTIRDLETVRLMFAKASVVALSLLALQRHVVKDRILHPITRTQTSITTSESVTFFPDTIVRNNQEQSRLSRSSLLLQH